MTRSLAREHFRALGTVCTVAVSAGASESSSARRALEAGRNEVEACERALTRFDPHSDLSRLNAAGGSWVAVDERLVKALEAARWARAETGGRFEPAILPALVAAGYDRSFELLTEREPRLPGGWRAGARFDVDARAGLARLEPGAGIDLGGIGKGFAAGRALTAMRTAWPALSGALVDLGGDIGVWGTAPEGGAWRIDIAEPRQHGNVAGTLELMGGGVATSGRDRRRFGPAGRLHHLIDPVTGAPAASGPLAVTVVASSAIEAEAHSTALAVADVDSTRAYLAARPGLGALVIPEEGEPIAVGSLPLARERPGTRYVITMERGRFP